MTTFLNLSVTILSPWQILSNENSTRTCFGRSLAIERMLYLCYFTVKLLNCCMIKNDRMTKIVIRRNCE